MKRFNKTENQSGVVLIILAILIVPLVIFIALAIDTGRLSASRAQLENTADLAALGALEAFMAIPPTEDYKYRVEVARKRAEQIAGFTVLLADTSRDEVVLSSGEIGIDDPGAAGTASSGFIKAGRWWFQPPKGANGEVDGCTGSSPGGCPCEDSRFTGPCFEHVPTAGAARDTTANAFQIGLSTKESSPLKNLFGRATGLIPGQPAQEDVAISVDAIATIIPRHAAFLVDLSGSTDNDTHTGPAASSRYRLNPGEDNCFNSNTNNYDGLCQCLNDGDPNPLPEIDPGDTLNELTNKYRRPNNEPILYSDTGQPIEYHAFQEVSGYGLMAARGPRASGSLPNLITSHYYDDYRCYYLDDIDEHYVVDTPSAANTSGYIGPEPLGAILNAINSALDVIEARAVSGDSITVIGFDHNAAPNLISARTIGPLSPDDDEFDELRELTNVGDISTFATRVEKAFFPLVPSDTDVPEALLEASNKLLDQPLADTADNFVVLFSDGLTNCQHDGGITTSATGEIILGPDECERQASDDRERFNRHTGSLDEVKCILSGECTEIGGAPSGFRSYVDSDITFHMVLVGDEVAPNTLLAKSPSSNTCITETEHRATTRTPFTVGGAAPVEGTYVNKSNANPYTWVNSFYYENGVAPTGGFWGVLRSPCDPADFPATPPFSCASGITHFDSRCANAQLGPINGVIGQQGGLSYLLCDPRCRSKRDQAEEFIEKIYSVSPFALVE